MNPCHFCGQPATIHYTSLIEQAKVQQHLCEGCARKHGVVTDDPSPVPPFDLQALVQLMSGQHAAAPQPESLKCSECGLKYAQFRAEGRLGCPHDYDAFHDPLVDLLGRVHRADRHAGKVPRGKRPRLDHLRGLLAEAVAAERYEDAAALRDRIRQEEGEVAE
jgi:protein arginine kinase activator